MKVLSNRASFSRRKTVSIVQLQDVQKTYPLGKTEVHALKGISFDIEKGDFVSIAGPSGSGKSTILNLIGCIDTATTGKVTIDGVETSRLSDKQITSLRHEVLGFIFQSFNLIPVLSVYENVEFPLLLGKSALSKREQRNWVHYLIDEVGLSERRNHKPNELSGGQRQRVAIARALATKPSIVMADEPTANLDSVTSQAIIDLMKKMNRELDTTFVFSTHDQEIVSIADHVIRLQDGIIEENYKTKDNGFFAGREAARLREVAA
jgi:putative ABC transport system ATP-binding protein